MATSKLPGTDAARYGVGDADLTIMYAAHHAFRRDLVSLARAAGGAAKASPDRQQAITAGWEVFKRQLLLHHTAEDKHIWPALRTRFATSTDALSVLDAMEQEHEKIDPLLAAVDDAFTRRRRDGSGAGGSGAGGSGAGGSGAGGSGMDGPAADDWPGVDRLADVTDVLVSTLTGHLDHEERDGLPLIAAGLTASQWRGVGRQIARSNGLSSGSEMFAWMLSGADPDEVRRTIGQLPPPLRLIYRAVWKPRYARTRHW
jgi:hypothetical protein